MGDVDISELPLLDVLGPAFDPAGQDVRAARDAFGCARTPVGVAVLSYRLVAELVADRRLVSVGVRGLAARGVSEGPVVEWVRSMLLNTEGADHTRRRTLVGRAFTPRAIEARRPAMRRTAEGLIDGFVEAGRVEFMAAFANPYPAVVICDLLGVPAGQHERFQGWVGDLGLVFSPSVAAELPRVEAALAGLRAAVEELIAQRRAEPGPDLTSALIAAEADGERLSADELRAMIVGMLFAGQDTTRNQLGRLVELLADRPDQWVLLARRPDLAPAVVAEGMRLVPSVPAVVRVAMADLHIGGVAVPAGTMVVMVIVSSNTDPAVFGPDADRFDPTAHRPASPISFGAGIHYCLGAALARAELAEALPILARRLGPIAVDGEPTRRSGLGITGPVTLPVRFGPATPTSGYAGSVADVAGR